MKLETIFISAVLSVAFLMSGCAGKSVTAGNTGFFKDYEKFEQSNDSSKQFISGIDMTGYKKIIIAPVEVVSVIPEDKQTPSQKKLYKEISEYLSAGYKKEIEKSGRYTISETKGPNTLKLESAISAVEVHFDDDRWNQFSPVSIGVTVVSYNAYMDEDVRILGEKRLVDAQTGEVLVSSMNIQKDEKITLKHDNLEFEDVKPALDSWLEQLKKDLSK